MGATRQYSGTAGRVENYQIGVFPVYASAKGRTFIDRELYLPRQWTEEDQRRRVANVPEDFKRLTSWGKTGNYEVDLP